MRIVSENLNKEDVTQDMYFKILGLVYTIEDEVEKSKKNKVFGLDENKISIFTKNKIVNYSKFSKLKCANLIVDSIYNEIKNK